MMRYTTSIGQSVEEIGEKHWALLNIRSCYQTYGWIKTVEDQRRPNVYYIFIREARRLVAVAPCYLVQNPNTYPTYNLQSILSGDLLEDTSHLCSGSLDEHKDYVATRREMFFPNLICATRDGYTSGPLFAKGLTDSEKSEAAQLLSWTFLELRQQCGCRVASFLYLDEANPLQHGLTGDWLALPMGCEARMAIQWKAFDEYVESFGKGKKFIKRERKFFKESGIQIQVQTLAELPLQHLAVLLHNVQIRYGHEATSVERLTERLEVNRQIPLENIVYVARRNGDIIGFDLEYRYDNMLFGRIVGFDYQKINRADYLYFNLSIYHPIAEAIKMNIREIDFGMGSMDAKVRRGCTSVKKYGLFNLGELQGDRKLVNGVRMLQCQDTKYLDLA